MGSPFWRLPSPWVSSCKECRGDPVLSQLDNGERDFLSTLSRSDGLTVSSCIWPCGYGSIPMKIPFVRGLFTSILTQLFWCEQKGYYWFWPIPMFRICFSFIGQRRLFHMNWLSRQLELYMRCKFIFYHSEGLGYAVHPKSIVMNEDRIADFVLSILSFAPSSITAPNRQIDDFLNSCATDSQCCPLLSSKSQVVHWNDALVLPSIIAICVSTVSIIFYHTIVSIMSSTDWCFQSHNSTVDIGPEVDMGMGGSCSNWPVDVGLGKAIK